MFTSLENSCSLNDTEMLRDCLRFLRRFANRCVAMVLHLRQKLSVLKRPEAREDAEGSLLMKESDVPISAACSDIERSVRAVQALLLRMTSCLDDSEINRGVALKQKDAEMERLQQLVFVKEKERLAAIAMASSPIAGWLRVGGTHQSGQRVATTSTLWRFWAVVRKDILFLYSAPGKVSSCCMAAM